jgi:AAA ATPase domain/Transcriptional regulatory protein, C terminal
MAPASDLTFGPFRLDGTHDRLWRGAQVLDLRRRSLVMLRYLAAHPGRLVTKAELRQHVWGGTHVTDTVLRVCVQEIRAALGDAADAPQYLATVGRQGYQFLVGDAPEVAPPLLPGPLVGRQGEVDTVTSWFQRAAHGARQLAFISGPAGVGKTTVVELWLPRLAAESGVRIAWGHCVEHYGEGEPYLPLLEALGDLSRGPQPRGALDTLRRYAPLWLVQLPGLLPDTELERLQRQVQGATATRMLRELAEVLEVLSAETPALVPVLFGLWRFYGVRSQVHTARELGETLLRLAQHADDPALAVVAHTALGVTQLNLGALPAARQHLEEGSARYTPDQRRNLVFRMGQDPGVACRANAARALWLLGYPDQALVHIHEALTLAHALSHLFSLAWAQCMAAFISQFRRDVLAVHAQAEAAVTLATEQGFPL